MIRNEREYQEALRQIAGEEAIAQQRGTYHDMGLTPEEVDRVMGPTLSFRAQLIEEVDWYERVRRRDFEAIHSLTAVGRLLIAARIANGLGQKDLAERLGVSEAQVSRDEHNEYHGVTLDRAQRILEHLGETITTRIEEKPASIAG